MSNKETSVGIKLVADLRNYQGNLKKAQTDTRKFGKNVKNNIGDVKNSFSGLMRGDLSSLPSFFKAATSSAGGFSKGLVGVKAALISTGIGAILVAIGLAIGAVTQYFKGTEEGQIVFKKVMNNIKAYTEPILQMFGKFGKALVHLFKGEFGQAWDTAKGAIESTGKQIEKNKQNVDALNIAEEAYIKTKRKNLIANKKLEAEIADARLKANDEDKYTASERQKAINEAIAKQKQLAANKRKELDLEIEIAQTKASFGDNDIETNNELAQLEATKFEIIREQNKKLMMISETQQRINRALSAEIALRERTSANTITRTETSQLTTIGTRTVNSIETQGVDTSQLEDMGSFLDANAEKTQKFRDQLLELNEVQSTVVNGVTEGFSNMANGLISSLGLASSGFEGFLGGMLQTLTKLIAMALSQSVANAIVGATASGAATGPAAIFTTPAFIATAVGGVIAAFAAIPKFATGGMVPGASFSGDKVLARLNSGEEVLTQNDPRHRNNMKSQGGNTSKQILPADVKIMDDHILISYTRAMARRKARTGY